MEILLTFTSVTIFTLMLTIGVNQSLEQLTSLWHQRAVLLRALFAVLVLVPAVVIALLSVFDLSPEVATGLALTIFGVGVSAYVGLDYTSVALARLGISPTAVSLSARASSNSATHLAVSASRACLWIAAATRCSILIFTASTVFWGTFPRRMLRRRLSGPIN